MLSQEFAMSESQKPEREYEKTGLYPENDKPFRVWALLGWLGVIVVALAAVAALLDTILI
tara:strand:- start:43617 stop:43796 length:180 start_codon:yes stop_codon:yes gene_type:complete